MDEVKEEVFVNNRDDNTSDLHRDLGIKATYDYSGFSSNIRHALVKLRFYERQTIKCNIDTLTEINRKFPQLLEPSFTIQGKVLYLVI